MKMLCTINCILNFFKLLYEDWLERLWIHYMGWCLFIFYLGDKRWKFSGKADSFSWSTKCYQVFDAKGLSTFKYNRFNCIIKPNKFYFKIVDWNLIKYLCVSSCNITFFLFLRIILLKLFQTVTLLGSLHLAKQGRFICLHQTCLFTNNFTWRNQVTVDWKNCRKNEEPNCGSQIVSVWKNSINLLLEQLIEIYNSLICLRHIAHNNFCYTVNKRSGKYYY